MNTDATYARQLAADAFPEARGIVVYEYITHREGKSETVWTIAMEMPAETFGGPAGKWVGLYNPTPEATPEAAITVMLVRVAEARRLMQANTLEMHQRARKCLRITVN